MTNETNQEKEQLKKIILLVVGGIFGLGLSYGLIFQVQNRASAALAEVLVIEKTIETMDETIKIIESSDLTLAGEFLTTVEEIKKIPDAVEILAALRVMTSPIVIAKNMDNLKMKVNEGDFIEVTITASVRGHFIFEIVDQTGITNNLSGSKQSFVDYSGDNSQQRDPIFARAIFQAVKKGDANFQFKKQPLQRGIKAVENRIMTARILPNRQLPKSENDPD